ncbi:MAG: hypothetical protein RBR54_07495 [Sulfurimonas sp.]|jgi:hypothetical protein|nr:hypothetical protein [Sulfurimonas sp.]
MKDLLLAFLIGAIVTFIFDFFFFLGIKINYTDLYNIEVYFNTLFADNQNILLFLLLTSFYGYLIIYSKNVKFIFLTLALSSLFSLAMLTHTVGNSVASTLFMQKDVTLEYKKRSYRGDIYYSGREKITFYDYRLEKMIQLNKKDIKE